MATQKTDPTKVVVTRYRPKKLPQKIGALIDLRYQLKLQKEKLEREMSDLLDDIENAEDAILLRLGEEDGTRAGGKLAQASISKINTPYVKKEQWADYFAYIKKGRGVERFSLLQRRPTVTTLREYLEQGKKVPGVDTFERTKLTLTKLQ